MRIKLLFILCCISFSLLAQPGKEAWHWRFGQAAVDFSSGTAVAVLPSPGVYLEACANVSDENTGAPLFFTNGNIVSDKNNNLMSYGTGLNGNPSASQALIVPWPNNPKKYFVISADKDGGNKGVSYSVVDLNLNNGLGKVTIKNKLLTPAPATEKVTAVRHCNGKDYWIITHSYNSNAYNAYRVNASGIDTTPVVSNIGISHQYISPNQDEALGYMKASPNGRLLAAAIWSGQLPFLELTSFDNITGVVSNPISINVGGGGAYGVSFSPDNQKLYASGYPGDTISTIYQFDLSSGIPSQIIASQAILGYSKWDINYRGYVGALQLGPDGKIYIARSYLDTLGVLNNPNLAGTSCNLQWGGVVLGPPSWQFCQLGLPNFIDANYAGIQMNIPDVQQCNSFTVTTLDAGVGFTNYYWSTGATTQTVSINSPGKYWVTVTSPYGCTRTDTVNAYVIVGGKADTLACDTFHANITQGGVLQYTWFDANHNPVRDFTQSGLYFADVNYVTGCAVRDSFNVTIAPSPQIDIGADTTFCKGNLLADATCSTCTYTWSTGETSSSITIKSANIYWVHVRDANGCTDSDTLVVHPQLNLFDFVMPNIVTPNNDLLNDEIDFSKHQFSALQLQIYNRWGQKVFETSDADAKWKPSVDDGTYFYTAQYKIDCGTATESKEIKGYITVVR